MRLQLWKGSMTRHMYVDRIYLYWQNMSKKSSFYNISVCHFFGLHMHLLTSCKYRSWNLSLCFITQWHLVKYTVSSENRLPGAIFFFNLEISYRIHNRSIPYDSIIRPELSFSLKGGILTLYYMSRMQCSLKIIAFILQYQYEFPKHLQIHWLIYQLKLISKWLYLNRNDFKNVVRCQTAPFSSVLWLM